MVQAREGALEVLVKRNASGVESLRNRVSNLDCRDARLNVFVGMQVEEVTDILELGHVGTLPQELALVGQGTVGSQESLSLRNLFLVRLPQRAQLGGFQPSEQGW